MDDAEPAALRVASVAALAIPLSYVIYRLTRTVLALLLAVYLYWIRPLFCRFNLRRYSKRWTVVTGATDGIGRAYTLELARRGLRRFVLIGRNASKLAAVRKELESAYEDVDVRIELFDFLDGDFGRLRAALADVDVGLAVNSVGAGREMMERYGDSPAADTQLLRVNGLGAAEFLSCILPPMERHGGGQIVVLSSSQGMHPIPMLASYSATKSLLCFLCECIDREYDTVSVQCLTPALVATKMTYYNLLLHHLFPWAILQHLIKPIYWLQHRRLVKLQNSQQPRWDANSDQNIATNNKKSGSLDPASLSWTTGDNLHKANAKNCQTQDYGKAVNVDSAAKVGNDSTPAANREILRRGSSKIPKNYTLRHRG